MKNHDSNHLGMGIFILPNGKANKFTRYLKQEGCWGTTIFLGEGTVENSWLRTLGLYETRKEILLMLMEINALHELMQKASKKFDLHKENKGIGFLSAIDHYIGKEKYSSEIIEEEEHMDYKAIFTIVDRGRSQEVLDSARNAGARGATIIHGRGSASEESAVLFNIPIQPEKDIVLMLTPVDKTEAIIHAITDDLNLREPGAGILFTIDTVDTFGLQDFPESK